jgi:septum formation protein
MRVWLASQSSRRAAMLQPLFPDLKSEGFTDVDETPTPGRFDAQVLSICQKKSEAVPDGHGFDIVIVCDTLLADPDDMDSTLGKPNDTVEAAMMLHRLSGRRHQVWSATGILLNGQWKFFVEYAIVEFDTLTDEQLVELVLSESWKGKAGGYDLAGPMGEYARLIDGHESTVLGIAGEAMEVLRTFSLGH